MNSLSGAATLPSSAILVDPEWCFAPQGALIGHQAAAAAVSLAIRSSSRVRGQVAQVSSGRRV